MRSLLASVVLSLAFSLFANGADRRGGDDLSNIPFWVQLAELHATGSFAHNFGDVAVRGNTLVVGAPGAAGKAYVFTKPKSGWKNEPPFATLAPSDEGTRDYFGLSVAIDGDTVAVGAYHHNPSTVYVFTRPRAGWSDGVITETAKLTASDGVPDDQFGGSGKVHGPRRYDRGRGARCKDRLQFWSRSGLRFC
jgi:hypothetical protein